ncbi:MAG: phage portal protein [Eubacteriales bacterium]|nr:phage portal protein [Eubacteriales bacterium]
MATGITVVEPEVIPVKLNHLGRQNILTSQTKIDESNIADVLSRAMDVHRQNRNDLLYLQRYEKGYQPILQRERTTSTNVNIKVVENTASEITDFTVGYVFGNKIALVQRSLSDDIAGTDPKTDSTGVSALNQMFDELGKTSLDQRLARDFCITGLGYRMALANEPRDGNIAPFRIIPLDPLNTFVVKSADVEHRPMMGCTYWVDDVTGEYHYTCYTETQVFSGKGGTLGFSEKPKVDTNGIGLVPIVEYCRSYDRMGCFERVIPLLDAENICASDRINSVSQFVQAFLWLHNAELPDGWREKLTASGILCTASSENLGEVKLEYLTAALDQSGAQTLSDYYYDRALEIAGVPGREAASGGSDTGQAVKLRNGWQIAETAAEAMELVFCESERQFLKVILSIVNTMTPYNLRLGDLDIKFSRNQTDNLLTRVQALSELIATGVDPLHSLKLVSLFPDPQQVYNDSDFMQQTEREAAEAAPPVVGDPGSGEENPSTVSDSPKEEQ